MFKNIQIISDLLGGINSKQRPTKIKDNQSVEIVGFDLDANSIRRAHGYTKLGTEADVTLTGKTLYRHTVSGSQELLVKTIGPFIKFYDTVSGNWFKASVATFTQNKRWCFKSFNGYMYGVNGVDNWIFWDGSSRSTLAVVANPGDIILTLSANTGVLFNVGGGTVMIEDEQIAYSSVSGDTLTGVTVVNAHTLGATVQTEIDSTTYGSLEKALTIEFYKNRMYMISAVNQTKMMWSKLATAGTPQTDLLDFTPAAGSGSAGFDFSQTSLMGLSSFVNGPSNSILVVFDRDGRQFSFVVTDTDTLTVDSFVEAHKADTYPVQPHLITQTENQLAYVDQYGHIQTLQYNNVNSPLLQQDISFTIHPSVEATTFLDGFIGYINKKLYVGGATTDSGINDIAYYNDFNYNAWGSYIHWDAVSITIYNGALYGLSQVTGDVFKLNDSFAVYVNDPVNSFQSDYSSQWVSKEWDFGKPLMPKQELYLRMFGIISSNCPAYVDIFFDGTKVFTFLIDGSNKNILLQVPNVACGTIVFGQGVMGGGLPGGTTRKEFQCQLAFSNIKNFLRAQIRIRLSGSNIDFEMIDGWVNAKELSENLWLQSQILIPH